MRSAPSRLMCGSDWPVALLNGDYERVWRETVRVIDADCAPRARRAAALGKRALRLYDLDVALAPAAGAQA